MHSPLRCSLALLVTLVGARAQDGPDRIDGRPAVEPSRLLIPIHTQPDDPIGGAYGVWAGGGTWKASFHDGFRFEPHAPQRATAPYLQWHTQSLRCGGTEVELGAGVPHWDAQRHETRFQSLREVYEVSAAGVEQSFVIDRRPAVAGDLVVIGRIDTNLHADLCTPRSGALRFADSERAWIEYGAAVAYDDKGVRTEVETGFDGERITLRVPAEFVARAEFPLTIDPLTTAISVGSYNFQIFDNSWTSNVAVGSTTAMVGLVTQHTAGDLDLICWTTSESAGLGTVFYSDITTTWSTRTVDSADMPVPGKWLIGFERWFPSSSVVASRVQVVDDVASPPAGTTLFLPNGTATPRVGGRRVGSAGVVVCLTATGLSATIVDAATPALGAVQNGAGNIVKVAVSRSAANTSPWCFISQLDTGIVLAHLFSTAGAIVGSGGLFAPTGASAAEIDGDDGRFVVTWTQVNSQISQRQLRAERFDFTGGSPTLVSLQTITSVPSLTIIDNGRVAYDFTTRSHWAATWTLRSALTPTRTARVARLGYHGAPVETVDVFSTTASNDPLLPTVAFDGDHISTVAPTFSVSYVDFQAAYTVMHRSFQYASNANLFAYGSSCANNTFSERLPPYMGSEFYTVSARGMPAFSPAYVLIGLAPTAIPLDVIGMNGCTMLVDPVIVYGSTADRAGVSTVGIALNDETLFMGDLYFQWVWPVAGANPLGLVDGPGVRVQVR